MTGKIKIGISSCLVGERVRYDGGHKQDYYLTDTFGKYVAWVPVCPEVEYGLSVPRESMRLEGSPDNPRLVTRVSRVDHSAGMKQWANSRLKKLAKEELCGFIFKSRSPSSGIRSVKVYTESGMPSKKGRGIFGGAFMDRFPLIPVEDDGRLHDPALRENFIELVFVFKRWRDVMGRDPKMGALVAFHTDHKLLIMAHSQKHYTELGRIVANPNRQKPKDVVSQYINLLMEALKLLATVKKNTNVLMHIMGYFKKQISSDEKKEMLQVIQNYHSGLVPLIAPIILINHYVRKYEEPYLKKQHYLNPHPIELMLRNHV
jgi:uncharacterized protein YbgA (DUF1722 family)/uncharacterized protein YbbK (DUF523 family)